MTWSIYAALCCLFALVSHLIGSHYLRLRDDLKAGFCFNVSFCYMTAAAACVVMLFA